MRGSNLPDGRKWPRRAATTGATLLMVALTHTVPSAAADRLVFADVMTLAPQPVDVTGNPAPPPEAKSTDDWHFIISMGLWGTAINGTAGVGPLEADMDLTFCEILENFSGGLMPGVEVRKGKWALVFNGVFARLESNLAEADVTVKMAIADLGLAYRLLDIPLGGEGTENMVLSLAPAVGVRYMGLELEIDPQRLQSRSESQGWLDPYLGGRVNLQINDQLAWRTEATVGGFGVGSDFAWAVQSTLDWRFHSAWELNVGYRVMSWDYDNNDFIWDATIHGPWIGMSYHLK